MYLSSPDINKRLVEMEFDVLNPDTPFEPREQVQVCSIDLRLSTEFWRQKKTRFPIDLDQSRIAELSPRRHWKKIVVSPGQSITIKPNEFILGHTHERFTVPKDLAGKVNTRSSFARLGIETNSATDFLNPGWRGYIPLEIINNSRNSIKIYPYLGIVQIMLIPLSSPPDRQYGTPSKSLYQNDDGGPSVWWRDRLFAQFKKRKDINITDTVLDGLQKTFVKVDDLGLYRFERFFSKLKAFEIDNAENIIERFMKKERYLSRINTFLKWFPAILFTSFLGYSVKAAFDQPPNVARWIVWLMTLLLLIPAAYFLLKEKVVYYDKLAE